MGPAGPVPPVSSRNRVPLAACRPVPERSIAPRRRRGFLLAAAWTLVCGAPLVAAPATEDVAQTARQLRAGYAAALEDLAKWCEARNLTAEAARTRQALGRRDPYKLYITVLPKTIGGDAPPENAAPDVVTWHERLQKLRREQAAALFDVARKAIKAGRAALACDLAITAIHDDPDHEGIRRLMGQQKFNGRWCTAFEVRKLRGGYVWDERYGWILQGNVQRYEQGQRLSAGKWISAEEDARQHRDIAAGWLVETEHYAIRTNHSLEAGARLGARLEEFYHVWQQLFIRYAMTEQQVIAAFEGRSKAPAADPPRHRVVYFRDRDEYARWLRATFPKVENSVGFYFEQTSRAYFFADKDQDQRTLYHEATHQLFHETRPVAPEVGRKANFWIIEGIAMFMESLRKEDGYFVLGGFDDPRLYAAQYRRLHDDFYVPLAELTTYGMERLQSDRRIATLYSQAAGLANFLVFDQQGRYREALVAYLQAVYSGRDDANTLARLTGASYSELDRQYRAFLEEGVRTAGITNP